MDASEQVILAKRLRQVTLHAGSQGARSHGFVRISRDKNGGDELAARDQLIVELRPCHSRHLHIRDQASRPVALPRIQKILGGRNATGR
jgi:hypothetical protein